MRALNLALNKTESTITELEQEIRGRKFKYAQIKEENASLKMIIEFSNQLTSLIELL